MGDPRDRLKIVQAFGPDLAHARHRPTFPHRGFLLWRAFRTPAAGLAASFFKRPASETLHNNGLMHRSKQRGQLCGLYHSITSSARASSIAGIVMPSALAVVRFTTRSNLIGCSTGISAGREPRRTLSTSSAARRLLHRTSDRPLRHIPEHRASLAAVRQALGC